MSKEKSADKPQATPAELKRLLNIEIPIIAVMGSRTMTLKEVLNLTSGSIIELDKPSDESFDLMVNNQLIGQGRTVRVGDNYGLRITRLEPVRETIRKLGAPGAEHHDKPAHDEGE